MSELFGNVFPDGPHNVTEGQKPYGGEGYTEIPKVNSEEIPYPDRPESMRVKEGVVQNPQYAHYVDTFGDEKVTEKWREILNRGIMVEEKTTNNPVNPSHYNGKECLEVINKMVAGKSPEESFLVGNVVKYLYRYNNKKGVEDVKKAREYLTFLVDHLEEKG